MNTTRLGEKLRALIAMGAAVSTMVVGMVVGAPAALADTGSETEADGPACVKNYTMNQVQDGYDGAAIVDNEEHQVWLGGRVISPKGVKFQSVSVGNKFVIALDEDGHLWSQGEEHEGQLGDNGKHNDGAQNVTTVHDLQRVTVSDDVVFTQVEASSLFTLALDSEHNVWAWGYNREGQLGVGDNNDRYVPTKIPGLTGVDSIAVSEGNGFALFADGSVKGWGDESAFGENGDVLKPASVTALANKNIVAVDGGLNTFIALDNNGDSYVWGNWLSKNNETNAYRYLEVAEKTKFKKAESVFAGGFNSMDAAIFAVYSDGTIEGYGSDQYGYLGSGLPAPDDDSTLRFDPVKVQGLPTNKTLKRLEVAHYMHWNHPGDSNGGNLWHLTPVALYSDGTAYTWGGYEGKDDNGNRISRPAKQLDPLRLYCIAYKANTDGKGGDDGSVSGMPETTWGKYSGRAVQVSSQIPERAGWEFTGWNTRKDGNGLSLDAGTWRDGETLYAQWKKSEAVVPAEPTEQPTQPSKPSVTTTAQPTTTVTPEKNAQPQPTESKKRLTNTGSAIAGIAVFAIIVAVAGALALRSVKRRRG